MILEETIKKLHDLKLGAMADATRELLTKPPGHKLSFEEQLGLLVEHEWTDRQNKALARRLKQAKLGQSACLEDVSCEPCLLYTSSRGRSAPISCARIK